MRMTLSFIFFAVLISAASPASADLVISEVMQNPNAVDDSNGEWFEVYNNGVTAINMNGYTLLDLGSNSHVIVSDLIVNPNEYVVLGCNDDPTQNGGVLLHYVYTWSTFILSNLDDEIIIQDAALNEITRIEYDGGHLWPNPTGASMYYNMAGVDENDPTHWFEETTDTYGDGDYGTPGGPPGDVTGIMPIEGSTWGRVKALYH